MADFDNDDFDDVVDNVKRSDTWMRIVFMVGFCVVLYVVSVVIWFLTGAQALFSIFTGSDNRNLRHLGAGLAEYVNQILRFITYNSEMRPFPFSPFPIGDETDNELDEDADEVPPGAQAAGSNSPGAGAGGQFDDLAFLSRQDQVTEEVADEAGEEAEQEAGEEAEQENLSAAQRKEPADEPGDGEAEADQHPAPAKSGHNNNEGEQEESAGSSPDRANNDTGKPG